MKQRRLERFAADVAQHVTGQGGPERLADAGRLAVQCLDEGWTVHEVLYGMIQRDPSHTPEHVYFMDAVGRHLAPQHREAIDAYISDLYAEIHRPHPDAPNIEDYQ